MHSESEASNQPYPRVFQRKKFKRRNNSRYTQKKKKEFEGLTADQNRYLKEIIERLISDYLQVPARDLQKQENSVSHSAAQNDPSFSVQDHQGVDSGIGGTDEELHFLELNDLPDDLLLNEVENRKQNRMAEFRKKLQSIDDKLNALYKDRAKIYEDFKDCLADAKDFFGKSVSTGLFP